MASRRSGGKRMRLDDDDDQDEVSICEAFVKKSIEKHSFFS